MYKSQRLDDWIQKQDACMRPTSDLGTHTD